MAILREKQFGYSTLGSLITIILGLVSLIFTLIIYRQEAIEIQKLEVIHLASIITALIVIPTIIFVLNYMLDAEKITFRASLIFITLLTMGVAWALAIYAGVFIGETVFHYSASHDHLGLIIIIIISLGGIFIAQFVCLYGASVNRTKWRNGGYK